MPDPPEIDVLLAEDGWMRRLARNLVADPNLADDLVQEAWLAALQRPGGARSARPWLAGVLRNLRRATARRSARRERHERAAARDGSSPGTAELVEEIRLRREVADQLLALEEPYRTVLYLRFFRDLPLKRIAAQTGVPLSTAHARLQSGLERMRARLDRTHGGDRGAWMLALTPLARSATGLAAGVLATPIGAVLMSTGAKIAATLLVASGALGLYLATESSEPPESAAPVTAAERPRDAADRAGLELGPPEDAARAEVPAAPAPDAREPADDALAARSLEGIVIDTARRPLPRVRVDVLNALGEVVVSAETGNDGRFRLPLAEEPRRAAWFDPALAEVVGGTPVVRDAALATLAAGLDARGAVVVIAAPKAACAGIVVDAGGLPLAGASVVVRVRQGLYRELGLASFTSLEAERWSTHSEADGGFQVADACGGESVFLDVELAGYAGREVALPPFGTTDLVVELEELDDAIDVTGRVVDARDRPVEDARVSMGQAIERTDADGRFRIRWSADEAAAEAHYVKSPSGAWVPSRDPLHVAAVKPGLLPAWRELAEEDLAHPLLLRLGEAPLTIAGRVIDADGRPVEGAAVWEIDPHRFGKQTVQQGEFTASTTSTIEEVLRGGGYGSGGVLTDAAGRFELTGLMAGPYTLRVVDPAGLVTAADRRVEAGARDVELVLAAEAGLTRVAGRVVSATGTPIAGVKVRPQRSAGGAFNPYGQMPARLARSVTTDAQGRFDLGVLAAEGVELALSGERIFVYSVALEDFDDPAAVEIVQPVLCELQVELVDPGSGVTHLVFLDAAGERLEVVESFGVYVTRGGSAAIRDGRSGVLFVPETARTLVLRTAEAEIARTTLQLDEEERTELRL